MKYIIMRSSLRRLSSLRQHFPSLPSPSFASSRFRNPASQPIDRVGNTALSHLSCCANAAESHLCDAPDTNRAFPPTGFPSQHPSEENPQSSFPARLGKRPLESATRDQGGSLRAVKTTLVVPICPTLTLHAFTSSSALPTVLRILDLLSVSLLLPISAWNQLPCFRVAHGTHACTLLLSSYLNAT